MATARISSDMIKPFNGDGDVVAWLQKINLVAKLSKITELHNFIPLYLEGSALSVYLEMEESQKEEADKIEKRLKEVFTDGPFIAYTKLTSCRWTGECVDVYASELRRLAGLAGFEKAFMETIVKLQFVTGFPDAISLELQGLADMQKMSMSDLIVKARILSGMKGSSTPIGAAAVKFSRRGRGRGVASSGAGGGSTSEGFRGKCFKCEGPHMARNCPEQKDVRCYACQELGHLSYNCPNSGNE